jgi:hypothetical protein
VQANQSTGEESNREPEHQERQNPEEAKPTIDDSLDHLNQEGNQT